MGNLQISIQKAEKETRRNEIGSVKSPNFSHLVIRITRMVVDATEGLKKKRRKLNKSQNLMKDLL